MVNQHTIKLGDGFACPRLAIGTATAHIREECSAHLLLALQKGFRHIDTAQHYANEGSIKIALAQWEGRREDVFICTKWWSDRPMNGVENPRGTLKGSLERMGLDYVDLYLIHKPNYADPQAMIFVWKEMEQLKKEGLTRAVGISNFPAEHIEMLSKHWETPPSVNQIEYHPYFAHTTPIQRLEESCQHHKIPISSFTTLVPIRESPNGPVVPIIERIAAEKNAKPAQVLIAWAAQSTEGPVVTNASKSWQYDELLETLDKVKLSTEEISEIKEAGKGRTYLEYCRDLWGQAQQ